MINDNDPFWAERFRMSAQDLHDQRQRLANVGRQVWNAATRAGRNVLGRTEAELEALGRAHLQEAEAQRALAQSMTRAASKAVAMTQNAARIVGRQAPAVARSAANTLARMGGQVAQGQEFERQQVRVATNAAGALRRAMTPEGTPLDPVPVGCSRNG